MMLEHFGSPLYSMFKLELGLVSISWTLELVSIRSKLHALAAVWSWLVRQSGKAVRSFRSLGHRKHADHTLRSQETEQTKDESGLGRDGHVQARPIRFNKTYVRRGRCNPNTQREPVSWTIGLLWLRLLLHRLDPRTYSSWSRITKIQTFDSGVSHNRRTTGSSLGFSYIYHNEILHESCTGFFYFFSGYFSCLLIHMDSLHILSYITLD